jgi:phosphate transport system substrate-binding protein
VLALLVGSTCITAAEELKIGGTGAALGTMRLLADEFMAGNPDIRIAIVPNLGSGGGIKAVVAGAIGLSVTSRPMNEDERKLGAVEVEYARTAFVFAISSKSRVTGITSRELADIYSGKMVAWADGSPVRIVLRPAGDHDTEIVQSISPEIRRGLAAAKSRPGVRFSVTDQDAADDLERIPGAIGPSSLALIMSERRNLKALALDGKEPTPINAASGSYPYYKQLFLVTGARRPAAVERFAAFVRSPAGRKILSSNGQWIP